MILIKAWANQPKHSGIQNDLSLVQGAMLQGSVHDSNQRAERGSDKAMIALLPPPARFLIHPQPLPSNENSQSRLQPRFGQIQMDQLRRETPRLMGQVEILEQVG
jgi:hypothetical protein